MSISGIPVQSGGVVVLAATAAKSGGQALAGLPAAGARVAAEAAGHARLVMVLGGTMLVAAAAVLRGSRRAEITAGEELTSRS